MEFSVLMSVYYKENPNYLKEAIESILNQTVKANEIVIVKDGSLTPELDIVIEGYMNLYGDLFKIVELKKNSGLGIALSKGIENCSFSIIARMDSDDIARRDRFEKQIKIMESKNFDVVGSNIAEFDGNINNIISERKVPEFSEDIESFAKKRNPFNHMTVMYKKESVLKVGSYKEFLWFEDYNLWIRIFLNKSKVYNIQEDLVYARTGKEMFSRRGGTKYIKRELEMQKFMLENKFISPLEYFINISQRMLVRLMPNKIRGLIYIKLLR